MALSAPNLNSLKRFNWRKLAQLANPQSVKDLDVFLDRLPARAGLNGLIAASVIWAIAGAALLVMYTNSVNLREVQKELTKAEALRPSVPIITYVPVSDALIKVQTDKMQEIYKALKIELSSGSVKITASSTRDFNQWRAAIGDLSFGGVGWRIQTKAICAGRDCSGGPLQATLSVQQLNINIPETNSGTL